MKVICAVLISLASWSAVEACNIPVFRYALERWRPDECEVVVFHQGGLTPSQYEMLEVALAGDHASQRAGSESDGVSQQSASPTVRLTLADLSALDPTLTDVWSRLPGASDPPRSLPYVVVRSPLGTNRTDTVWHGPLRSLKSANVFASPARSEVARRLLAGHSVVWLVITGADRDRNARVVDQLRTTLSVLESKIQLPDGVGLPGSELLSEIPLVVKFSVLEIGRDDPQERLLVDFLSGLRPSSVAKGEPLVIPVFGRGRALEVIPAPELQPQLVEDLVIFLSGACSCQVKEQNPGFDLLFSIDWNRELFGEGFEPPPPRTADQRPTPLLLTIPPGR